MIQRSLAVLLIFFIVVNGAFAQKDYYTSMREGDQFFEKQDYKNALASYFKALHKEPNNSDLLFKVGLTYLFTETKHLGVSYLEKAYKTNPDIHPDILLHLGTAYQANLQFVKAKYCYEQYKKRKSKKTWAEIDQRIDECIVGHGLLSNPLDIIIENVGSTINSRFDDYGPIVSPDGLTMIFTSNRSDDENKIKAKQNFEDIYIVRNESGEWGIPKKISPIVNVYHHDAAASLSADGKKLFIYYSQNRGDIFVSTLSETNEWLKPTPLNKNINTVQFRETAACISADGKRLFFSSDRAGGKGRLDIYMSELDAAGEWGKPVNLGDVINTPGDEDSPFIHPDGVTLYFSSDGHRGMGSSDIFKSEFKDGKWQKPQNMGYPLNSMEYDGFFTISKDKSVAYFATRRKYGVGEYDILKATYRDVYTEKTPPAIAKNDDVKKTTAKPGAVTVQGKALDKTSSEPVEVAISLVNSRTNKQVAHITSNKATGNYEITITQPGEYTLTAERNGYLFNSVNIRVDETGDAKKIRSDFQMLKADVGSVMVLRNIFFDVGKADLKPSSISELEKLRNLLMANPHMKVQINGHTDNVGDPQLNKTLSLKRALAVVNHLALNGIDFDRLSAKGFGSERPVASNDDEIGGRELNRRTEIEIIAAIEPGIN